MEMLRRLLHELRTNGHRIPKHIRRSYLEAPTLSQHDVR